MLNTKLLKKTSKSTTKPTISFTLNGEEFNKLTLNLYKQENYFAVQYIFDGPIKKTLLQKIAKQYEQNFYLISSDDAEKINNAIK